MFGVAFAPFLNAKLQVIGIFFGDDWTLALGELGAAGRIRQYGMLHDVLGDCFDQWIVAHGLHKYRAVVVARCGRHVHLDCQPQVFLQQPVMDVLDALEPRHARIVNMMRFVVKHGQFVDLAHDLAEIHFAISRLADGLVSERREKVIAQVVIFQRRLRHFAKIDAVNVGEEDVPRWPDDAHVILDM